MMHSGAWNQKTPFYTDEKNQIVVRRTKGGFVVCHSDTTETIMRRASEHKKEPRSIANGHYISFSDGINVLKLD